MASKYLCPLKYAEHVKPRSQRDTRRSDTEISQFLAYPRVSFAPKCISTISRLFKLDNEHKMWHRFVRIVL